MRAPVLWLLIFLVAPLASAQAAFAAQRSDRDDAQAVARAVQAHYRDAVTLQAVFLETYRAGSSNLRVESGKVYFLRPGRMRWNYESPQKKVFLVDGHYAWFYIPADHTTSRTPVRKSDDWRTPFSLLTGKARLSDLCRKVSIAPNQRGPSSPPAGHVVLNCTPKHKEAFLDAQIEVDQHDRIVRVLVEEPGKVSTEVSFGNWQENGPLPKSMFHFQVPSGVSVVNNQAIAGSTQ